jgi:hypothetical protein
MRKNQVLPANPHGARIAEIFTYGWSWIEAPLDQHQLDTAWKTNSKYRLKPRVLWSRWQDTSSVIGVRFGSSTRYAMLDIDVNSPYIDQVDNILGALETIGIVRTVPIRSSWSGGLHIYCPLPQEFPTFGVACALKQCLEAQGFHLAPGELEAFPNVKSYGKFWEKEFTEYNGHRLPLQPGTGSCVLGSDLQPIPGGYDLAVFLAMWDNAVLLNDSEAIAEAISVARANRRARRRRATGLAEEWKADLERIIAEGWTGHGQTNDLLKDIATYGRVFERLAGNDLADYIERIAESRPGYDRWCQHRHEIHRKAYQWALSVTNYYWPLGSTPLRDRTRLGVNQARAEDARERISAAVRELRFEIGLSVTQLGERLVQMARCSLQTLYRHRDLWHPQQPAQDELPVIDAGSGLTASTESLRSVIRRSLGIPESTSITGNGGENEACNFETLPLKNLHSGGKEGGCGGKEGLSTGWLPPLDWKEGPVDA